MPSDEDLFDDYVEESQESLDLTDLAELLGQPKFSTDRE